MDISMEFKEPFFGIVYANFDRNAACSFIGNGSTKYELQLPLRGCGTIQASKLTPFQIRLVKMVDSEGWRAFYSKAVPRIFCRRRFYSIFFFGGGRLDTKNSKNVYKFCLYPFLLRFYESDKHFFWEGRECSNPPTPPLGTTLFTGLNHK
jgi:hypothetical protein